jgi:glycosyltransferase involved in cell wall biosynthesis
MGISSLVALLISIYFPPEFGGGSTGAWNRAMVLHKMGYSVIVLCGFPSYPSGRVLDPKYKGKFFYVETQGPFTVIRLRLIPVKHDGIIRRLVIFLNFIFLIIILFPLIMKVAGKISLVYARAPILFSSFSGFFYSKMTGSFFVYEAPDLWPEELVAVKTKLLPIIMKIGKVAAKLSYAIPDVIVTISDPAAKLIIRTYNPRAPVYGIPVGVDPDKFPRMSKRDARADLVEKRILSESLLDKFIVLYSGLLSEAQHVETLFYAAEKLKSEQHIVFLIVGDGPHKQQLQQFKLQNNLENVYFLERQPRNMMPFIISSADICMVMLSREPIFDIALPTKFYEYLASGKPLLGACSGILAEIITSNNIGRVIDNDDSEKLSLLIREFSRSSDLIQKMEDNCYVTLQRFSLDAITSHLANILDKEGALVKKALE